MKTCRPEMSLSESLLPERDEVASVAVLRTSRGLRKRAVKKLCRLPLMCAIESHFSKGLSMSGLAAASSSKFYVFSNCNSNI